MRLARLRQSQKLSVAALPIVPDPPSVHGGAAPAASGPSRLRAAPARLSFETPVATAAGEPQPSQALRLMSSADAAPLKAAHTNQVVPTPGGGLVMHTRASAPALPSDSGSLFRGGAGEAQQHLHRSNTAGTWADGARDSGANVYGGNTLQGGTRSRRASAGGTAPAPAAAGAAAPAPGAGGGGLLPFLSRGHPGNLHMHSMRVLQMHLERRAEDQVGLGGGGGGGDGHERSKVLAGGWGESGEAVYIPRMRLRHKYGGTMVVSVRLFIGNIGSQYFSELCLERLDEDDGGDDDEEGEEERADGGQEAEAHPSRLMIA